MMGNGISQQSSKQPESSTAMPFFRAKPSKESSEKLQAKLYLATHAPDNVFDISECDLCYIPTECFSTVKVLLKEIFVIHSNRLSDFKDSGSYSYEPLKQMITLKAIDAHNNRITHIPAELCSLRRIQELNFESNNIKYLPKEIGNLHYLTKLNLRSNRLDSIPAELSQCTSLIYLDISNNHIKKLPHELANLRHSLKSFSFDADIVQDPPIEISQQGTEALMRYMCTKQGINYDDDEPQQTNGTAVYPKIRDVIYDKGRSMSLIASASDFDERVKQMQSAKDAHWRHLVAGEYDRNLTESQSHECLLKKSDQYKKDLLQRLANDEQKINRQLQSLEEQKQRDKQNLLAAIQNMEEHANSLMAKILATNSQIAKSERLLAEEQERKMVEEQWFTEKWIKHEKLRREELERSMASIIQNNYSLEYVRNNYENQRKATIDRAMQLELTSTNQIQAALKIKDEIHQNLCNEILNSENMQKDALLALMEQRDTRTNRLRCQMEVIQNELANLSMLERKNQEMKTADNIAGLEQQRQDLTKLLMNLMYERDTRAKELQKRLVEMDTQRDNNRKDFWLCQYQKLMDTKPVTLIEAETTFDIDLVKVLNKLDAGDYAPVLARHQILSMDSLAECDEHSLNQMGIHSIGIRKGLLVEIEKYRLEMFGAKSKGKAMGKKASWQKSPRTDDEGSPSTSTYNRPPSAPPLPTNVAARFELECVICMDRQVSILFTPCGHVACCSVCADKLVTCPLCRAELVLKVDLDSCAPSAPSDGK